VAYPTGIRSTGSHEELHRRRGRRRVCQSSTRRLPFSLPRSTRPQITLVSSDGEEIEVEKSVAYMSKLVTNMIEDQEDSDRLPLANVRGDILKLTMDWCKKHADAVKKAGVTEEAKLPVEEKTELEKWDKEFAAVGDQTRLFELILAANFLDIKNLLDLMCLTVANMIKGKDPSEIRATFNIENDFTPEEEAEVRRENQWAFE
jgi:S-phase kinase-associated protein 1